MLSDGKYVVNSKVASKHGRLLAMINEGKAPKFAVGGHVSGFCHGGNNNTINVHAPGAQRGVGAGIKVTARQALDAAPA